MIFPWFEDLPVDIRLSIFSKCPPTDQSSLSITSHQYHHLFFFPSLENRFGSSLPDACVRCGNVQSLQRALDSSSYVIDHRTLLQLRHCVNPSMVSYIHDIALRLRITFPQEYWKAEYSFWVLVSLLRHSLAHHPAAPEGSPLFSSCSITTSFDLFKLHLTLLDNQFISFRYQMRSPEVNSVDLVAFYTLLYNEKTFMSRAVMSTDDFSEICKDLETKVGFNDLLIRSGLHLSPVHHQYLPFIINLAFCTSPPGTSYFAVNLFGPAGLSNYPQARTFLYPFLTISVDHPLYRNEENVRYLLEKGHYDQDESYMATLFSKLSSSFLQELNSQKYRFYWEANVEVPLNCLLALKLKSTSWFNSPNPLEVVTSVFRINEEWYAWSDFLDTIAFMNDIELVEFLNGLGVSFPHFSVFGVFSYHANASFHFGVPFPKDCERLLTTIASVMKPYNEEDSNAVRDSGPYIKNLRYHSFRVCDYLAVVFRLSHPRLVKTLAEFIWVGLKKDIGRGMLYLLRNKKENVQFVVRKMLESGAMRKEEVLEGLSKTDGGLVRDEYSYELLRSVVEGLEGEGS